MKKSVVVLLVLGLMFGALLGGAEAKKKKKKKPRKPARVERVVEFNYTTASPGVSGVVGLCLAAAGVEDSGCTDVATSTKEAYVMVEITDASGQPVNFDLAQDTDTSTPYYDIFASGCGKTDAAIPITPGLPLRISTTAAGGPDCPGVATTGSVKAVLSNFP
ncbi:MAG TPA: hypothetical protein VIG64_06355 [Actinomycetota bacterium]